MPTCQPSNSAEFLDRLAVHVQACRARFGLPLGGALIVGASGGKDSTVACIVLRHLGYEVYPAIVDIGYKRFDVAAVNRTLAGLGFSPRVLSPSADVGLVGEARKDALLTGSSRLLAADLASPCGLCSSTKRLLLTAYARSVNARHVVLAHHREDLLATLLKDYFLDRYQQVTAFYEPKRFQSFLETQTVDLVVLATLVGRRLAAPMGVQVHSTYDTVVLRPLAFVPESEIRNFVRVSSIEVAGSGCSHDGFQPSATALPPTKRELVHAWLTARLGAGAIDPDELLELGLRCLNAHGYARWNPRALREQRCSHV